MAAVLQRQSYSSASAHEIRTHATRDSIPCFYALRKYSMRIIVKESNQQKEDRFERIISKQSSFKLTDPSSARPPAYAMPALRI